MKRHESETRLFDDASLSVQTCWRSKFRCCEGSLDCCRRHLFELSIYLRVYLGVIAIRRGYLG